MKKFLSDYGLFFAWVIAVVAMFSTLVLSEILRWPVCILCWYQRIALYPLVIILGIAAYRDDKTIIPYALPFPCLGFLFSLYQYLEQMFPNFGPIEFCTQELSCRTTEFIWFGFITLPLFSVVACVMIAGLLLSQLSSAVKR